MPRLRERLTSGVFLVSLQAGFQRGFGLLSMVLAARILGPARFGVLSIGYSTVTMLVSVTVLGMGTAATKFLAESSRNEGFSPRHIVGTAYRIGLTSSLVAACVLILFRSQFSMLFGAAASLKPVVIPSALLLVVLTIQQVQVGCLLGLGKFRMLAISALASGVSALAAVPVLSMVLGPNGALLGLLGANLVGTVVNHRTIATAESIADDGGSRPRDRFESPLRSMVSFGFPTFLAGAILLPMTWLATLAIARGGGLAEVAYFTAGTQIYNAILVLPSAVGQALFPLMVERRHVADTRRYRLLWLAGVGTNALVALPLIAIAYTLSQPLFSVYGAGFAAHAAVLRICVLTAGFVALLAPSKEVLLSANKVWLAFSLNVLWAACFGLFLFVFSPMDALSASRFRLLAYMLHACWTIAATIWILRRPIKPVGSLSRVGWHNA